MTPAEQRAADQKIREAAQNDIADIDALKESRAFNRYFIGQLNKLYHDNVNIALTGAKRKDRTKARHRATFIKELMQMPAAHRTQMEELLRTPMVDPTKPPRPVQVG